MLQYFLHGELSFQVRNSSAMLDVDGQTDVLSKAQTKGEVHGQGDVH
jgi:hypothetical protein